MQVFSAEVEHAVLCDTPLCRSTIQSYPAGAAMGAGAAPPVETVVCVMRGQLDVRTNGAYLRLAAGQGVQIPAAQGWSAAAGDDGARLLQVDSPHPGFEPARALMPPLNRMHRFSVAGGQKLVYTDYVRGGVLDFAPGYAAEKHFHQDADEIFWFFSGLCRVGAPDGEVVLPAGTLVYTPAGEWHIIENAGDQPLLMFLTVTPNIVPSHTFFYPDGTPHVRSMEPLTAL